MDQTGATAEMNAYILVGSPGSGKSHYAGELVLRENATIISGDSVREELYGDASIQGDWVRIHDRIESYISECTGLGLTVVLDGTHWKKSYRAEAITLLQSYGYTHIEAVVCNPPLETCLERNRRRSRNVPEHVLKRMYEGLQQSLKSILDEPFAKVTFVD